MGGPVTFDIPQLRLAGESRGARAPRPDQAGEPGGDQADAYPGDPVTSRQIAGINAERRIPAGTLAEFDPVAKMMRMGPDDECPTQAAALNISPVWTSAGLPVPQLRGRFNGAACFLACGGPSLTPDVVRALDRRGLLVAAVNNVAAATIRPDIWFACDDPRSFHEAIWTDPAVMKFQKLKYLRPEFKWAGGDHNTPTSIRRWNGTKFATTNEPAGGFPNVFGFLHEKGWDASRFLTDPVPTWGVPKSMPIVPHFLSIMLPAIWLLYWLGVRRLYLVGCDFRMPKDGPQYAFDQDGNPSSNNGLYTVLDAKFAEWRPFAEAAGYTITNCTGDGTDGGGGRLRAFRRLTLDAGIAEALDVFRFPSQIVTAGHYIKP